ncbi:MAG TPA: alpha/beta hydrolase [Polyangiaceae bacterium]|nr:alpha/beta hydrolase [Polyangiaceae bacterium]
MRRGFAGLGFGAWVLSGCLGAGVGRAPVDGRFDVGGLALHLHCEGAGAPTVVFDSGLGRAGGEWFATAEAAGRTTAKRTRACAYDRAGYGTSDPPIQPHSNRQMSRELFTLLDQAGERGPFVLVGHSMGGMNARLFLDEHPDSVAGLVLVDASPDPPPIDRVTPEQRAEFERGLAHFEGLDLPTLLAGFHELDASKASLGDKPLVILVAGRLPDEALAEGIPDAARAAARAELAARQTSQQRLTTLSSNRALVLADQAGHDIPKDAPQLLARAIAAVVQSVRSGTPLDATGLRGH